MPTSSFQAQYYLTLNRIASQCYLSRMGEIKFGLPVPLVPADLEIKNDAVIKIY
jgi:hypothetical protein